MTETNADKRPVQALASVPMLTTLGACPRQRGSEIVEFSVKGPVTVSLDEDEGTTPGCSVLDLQFSTPSEVSLFILQNFRKKLTIY
jgi:hypothetical protein